MRLPEGQRALILVKLDDIVGSDDPNLSYATSEFLELLLLLGIRLDAENYARIAGPALSYAFEHDYDGRQGRGTLQEAIEEAAASAGGEAFGVLEKEVIGFLDPRPLEEKPGWYLQRLRQILQALMANPSCTTGARGLAEALRGVNGAQRTRTENRFRFEDRS